MSLLFALRGHSSTLSVDFYNPIVLDPNYDYSLALIGLHTCNSIPNIEEGVNNKFYYWELGDKTKQKVIHIPTGSYEISDIESLLQKHLISSDVPESEYNDYFSLKPNNNTLKCEIKSRHAIDFTHKDGLAKLLGYTAQVLKPDTLHESDLPVQIVKVETIHVDCNITSGSYDNSRPSHTIFEFGLNVDPGFTIDIEPHNLNFIPVNNKTDIHNITVQLLDQNSEPVNFRGEKITVRLVLRRLP